MKNWKAILGTVVALVLIVFILLNNKSKSDAKAKSVETLKSSPVSVVQAKKQSLSDDISQVGTITAVNDVAIVSETQGRVTAVYAKVGDYKPAGSVLVQVDSELRSAAYVSAEVAYQKAKKDFDRNDALLKEGGISDSQLEGTRLNFKTVESQFITARRQLSDTRIKTPISGTVTARTVDMGTMVSPGMVIGNVVDISKLKLKFNAAELDAFKMKTGDEVTITTDVYPGVKYTGKIETVSFKADDAHTYPVEVSIVNSKENPLRAGMFGRVSYKAAARDNAIVIPREALVGSLKTPQVYVVAGDVAKLRDVIVGSEVGTNLEIRSGLSETDQVVVSGQNNLRDGVAVTIVK
ncbi:MAG: efflux RND transporter periplasmic adaptor subunit [Rhizobacter sp.]|nr:efflux RND transporter periplasmic adaptor subunit [Chlorobiales bacterium]